MSEIRIFFERLPTVTRTLLISTIAVSTLCVFDSRITSRVVHNWYSIVHDWQFWRPVSGFFFSDMQGLQGLMQIYSLYTFSKGVEENKFGFNSVDYAFYLFIIMPLIVVCSVILPMPSLLFPLIGALMYTWSRANRYNQVMVYFVKIPAEYLPIASLAFTFLLSGPTEFFVALAGMCAAYFYQCLESRTLGPVYKFICDSLGVEQQRNNPLNRVGTVHTMTELDGYLSAPGWFRSAVGPLVSPRVTQQRKGGVNTLNSSSAGSASGVAYSHGANPLSFRGKGQRLGD